MLKVRWIDWTVASSWVVGGGLFLGGLSVAAAGDDPWAASARQPSPVMSDAESANLVPPPPVPGRSAPAVTVPVPPSPPERKPNVNAGWAPSQPAALPTSLESDPPNVPPQNPVSTRPAPVRPTETPVPAPAPAEPRIAPTPSVWGSYKPVNQPVSSPPPPPAVRHEQPAASQAVRMPQGQPPATTPGTTAKTTATPMTTELQQRVMAACGAAAQKVAVARQSDGVLTVEVRVQNPTDAEAVSAKVLALKEMMSLGATLRIVIDNPGR